MKKIALKIFAIVAFGMMSFSAMSQENTTDLRTQGYLFSKFEMATVKFQRGSEAQYPMNYFMAADKFHFIERGELQELLDFQKIYWIEIKGHKFYIQDGDVAYELLNADPQLYVNYSCTAKPKDLDSDFRNQNSGQNYGFRSNTSSATTYYNRNENSIVKANLAGYEYGPVRCKYKINIGGKEKRFKTIKDFVKLFPKAKRAALEAFVDEHKVDINRPSQVLELCKFAMMQ